MEPQAHSLIIQSMAADAEHTYHLPLPSRWNGLLAFRMRRRVDAVADERLGQTAKSEAAGPGGLRQGGGE